MRAEVSTMFNPVPVPFFGAKKVADGFAVRGDLSHEFGHRVPAETGGPDDGVFAGWKWQGRTLTVEVDRYGFAPLFYFSRGDEFGISPNLVRLLQEGAPLDIDREAVAVYLHLGFFIGNQTPFRHIKVVPPNRSFTWDGTLHVEEVRHIGSQLKITQRGDRNVCADVPRRHREATAPKRRLRASAQRRARFSTHPVGVVRGGLSPAVLHHREQVRRRQ